MGVHASQQVGGRQEGEEEGRSEWVWGAMGITDGAWVG